MRDTTKTQILACFNKLLETRPFDKVTVDMIAKESDISKSTFYRYFLDKYDVMNYSYKKLVDEIFDNPGCKGWRDMFRCLAQASRANATRLRNAYESVGINSYSSYLYNYSYNAVRTVTVRSRGSDLTIYESCRLCHFCFGPVGLIREWLEGGTENMTDDDMAQVLYDSMPESLRDLW